METEQATALKSGFQLLHPGSMQRGGQRGTKPSLTRQSLTILQKINWNPSYAVECLKHSVMRDNAIVRVWTQDMNEYLWFLVLWLSGKSQAFEISCTLSRNLNLRLMYKCIIRYKVFLSFPGSLLLFKHLPYSKLSPLLYQVTKMSM